jgi:hypothetical protein
MIFIYIGIGVVVLMVVGYGFMLAHQKKMYQAVKEDAIKTLQKWGQVRYEHHHLVIDLKDESYQILFYHVPANAELTINSKTMWEVKTSGQTSLINQTHFLSSSLTKMVIVFPTTLKMKRYINENEMEFIVYNKKFHNMYVIRPHELQTLLEELSHA